MIDESMPAEFKGVLRTVVEMYSCALSPPSRSQSECSVTSTAENQDIKSLSKIAVAPIWRRGGVMAIVFAPIGVGDTETLNL